MKSRGGLSTRLERWFGTGAQPDMLPHNRTVFMRLVQ
jgi:hypothetical protein